MQQIGEGLAHHRTSTIGTPTSSEFRCLDWPGDYKWVAPLAVAASRQAPARPPTMTHPTQRSSPMQRILAAWMAAGGPPLPAAARPGIWCRDADRSQRRRSDADGGSPHAAAADAGWRAWAPARAHLGPGPWVLGPGSRAHLAGSCYGSAPAVRWQVLFFKKCMVEIWFFLKKNI